MNKKIIILVGVFLVLLSYGCNNKETINQPTINPPPDEDLYVPGEVIVAFKTPITNEQLNSFIKEFNLSVKSRTYDSYYFWVEVPADSVTYYIVRLSKENKLFTGVSEGDYPYDDIDPTKKYLFLSYKAASNPSDTSEGKLFLENLGLALKKIDIIFEDSTQAVINVPIGEELYFVNKFNEYEFIDFSELNYVTHTF